MKPILFIVFLLTIVIALSIAQVVVSNSLSTKGIVLGKLEEETKVYKTQNALLREQLLKTTSFTSIASKAAELGFVRKKDQVYVAPLPIAINQ